MTELVDIIETFDLIDEWDQRYQYLIELGEEVPQMPIAEKTEDHRVKGCMSKVWVCAHRDPQDAARLVYHGECDTSIIQGVLALLLKYFSDRTIKEAVDLDADPLFEKLNLFDNLSPTRHVGIYAIVELMKVQARILDANPSQHVS